MTPRLATASLAIAPRAVMRPRYDRSALRIGIVHLGLGAFVRAHLAVATEAAIEASGDLRWGLCGVSMRNTDTRDALAPQDGLYAVALRDADPSGQRRQRLQVVGCLAEVLVASEAPDRVIARIAAPDTRIVSLTITEKGYAGEPGGALELLARGLALRQACGLAGLTLLSLDNLAANGRTLRARLLSVCTRLHPRTAPGGTSDSPLADWVKTACSFPDSMVDRIVPRCTDHDRAAVASELGLEDAAAVVAEPFFDWAVVDDFVQGRPEWAEPGVRFVDDAAPWEQLKLRMVNGAHSAIAYIGVQAGWHTVDAAMQEPTLVDAIDRLLRDEVQPYLPALPGLDLHAYRLALLRRFANPALAHRTLQIAMDGSQKLPLRWLPSIGDALASGHSCPVFAVALAAWIRHLGGTDEAGRDVVLQDPMADALRAHRAALQDPADSPSEARHWLAFEPIFGALADSRGAATLVRDVAAALDVLHTCGVRAALQRLATR